MATMPQFVPVEVVNDFDFPQREAAFFYGLFLRGHSPEQLRRDIEVPPAVLAKWHREAERDPQLRDIFSRMADYRRHVLAIFDSLVGSDGLPKRVQYFLQPLLSLPELPCNPLYFRSGQKLSGNQTSQRMF